MSWKLVAVFVAVFVSPGIAEDDKEPRLRIMVKSNIYNVGDKRVFYCQGENLLENIEWLNPHGAVIESRSPKNTRVFVEKPADIDMAKTLVPMMIQSAKLEDNGNWTCKSGNLSQVMDIQVGEKAQITLSKDNIDANEGSTATLNCHAKGFPIPTLQWYKMTDAEADFTDQKKYSLRIEENNIRLTIKNLAYTDAGLWACKATQGRLTYFTEKTLNLNVKHKPIMQHSQVNEIFAILNETKEIMCEAVANPPPEFEWYRRHNNFDKPEPKDIIFTAPDKTYSILTIHMYNESFLGQYVCTATNPRGRESRVFDVLQGSKPNPPDSITLLTRSDDELVFNVTCSTCLMYDPTDESSPDNLGVKGYFFELVPYKEGYDIPDWTNSSVCSQFQVDFETSDNTTFPVGPLLNGTQYYVRVRSRNDAGYSSWLEKVELVSTTNYAVTVLVCNTAIIVSTLMAFITY